MTSRYKFNENLSYKFVALGVALILWISMLGRRDATTMVDYELRVQLAANFEMATKIPTRVKVEVAGPRVALKKIDQMNRIYVVDLSTAKAGRQTVNLTRDGITNLPVGARVLSIEPREFTVQISSSVSPSGE